jgi:hypothetical protein
MEDTVETLNEQAEIMATITDKASAEAAAEKLEALLGRMNEITRRADRLTEPRAEQKKALADAYVEKIQQAMQKIEEENQRITNLASADVNEVLEDIFKKLNLK